MSAHLLIVDDSASIRQMVAHVLTTSGYAVDEAPDGATALQLARESQFDAVVMDMNMPQMDGLELMRQLRALPAYRFTPLMMLTTECSAERKFEGRKAGATCWLVKPFDPMQLVATVRKVLG